MSREKHHRFKSDAWAMKCKTNKAVKKGKKGVRSSKNIDNSINLCTLVLLIIVERMDASETTRPMKKYCDFTGLEANYVDKTSGLHYHDLKAFNYMKAIPKSTKDQYYRIRVPNPPNQFMI